MNSKISSKHIEVIIEEFVRDNYDLSNKQIKELNLSKRMSLVEMKDINVWNEFRSELRKIDYVI